jgi:phospholipid/cholesterol/gamma-HCH transport system substrate-binding protein
VEKAANSISVVAQKAGNLSDQGTGLIETVRQTKTIDHLNSTLVSVEGAADQVQVFMKINQHNLRNTLISIEELSKHVTLTVRKLAPLSEQIQEKNLLENLEIISRNAAQLTTNLNEVSTQLKDSRSHLQIQQIMDSAQSLLNNLNKITSDVDELTGNPSLRRDILRLIQGLTNLLSSTQLLQQQVAYDKVLNQVAMERDRPKPLQP